MSAIRASKVNARDVELELELTRELTITSLGNSYGGSRVVLTSTVLRSEAIYGAISVLRATGNPELADLVTALDNRCKGRGYLSASARQELCEQLDAWKEALSD